MVWILVEEYVNVFYFCVMYCFSFFVELVKVVLELGFYLFMFGIVVFFKS